MNELFAEVPAGTNFSWEAPYLALTEFFGRRFAAVTAVFGLGLHQEG